MKEVLPTKLRLDKLYLRNRSITTDLDVMFWTAVTMLPNVRTLEVPQQYLYWGPVITDHDAVPVVVGDRHGNRVPGGGGGGGGVAVERSTGCGDGLGDRVRAGDQRAVQPDELADGAEPAGVEPGTGEERGQAGVLDDAGDGDGAGVGQVHTHTGAPAGDDDHLCGDAGTGRVHRDAIPRDD